jgi:hypothetical protein
MKQLLIASVLAVALSLNIGSALAVDLTPVGENNQTQKSEQIYGNQLMTQKERIEYRAKMGEAKNDDEREKIRKKHYNAMRIRAKARGVFLPDEHPAKGGGKM